MLFDGANSKVENTLRLFPNNTRYSVLLFFRARSAGEGGANGKILALDNTDSSLSCRCLDANTIRIRRDFAVTQGSWDTAYNLNEWTCLAYSHVATLAANPTVYTRRFNTDSALVLRTPTQTNIPAGGLTGYGTGFCIGNNSNPTVTFDGDICFVQFWSNRILTQQEFQQAMLQPGIISDGLDINMWLLDDFKNRTPNGTGNGTPTAMAKGGMPPGIRPYLRRQGFVGKMTQEMRELRGRLRNFYGGFQ